MSMYAIWDHDERKWWHSPKKKFLWYTHAHAMMAWQSAHDYKKYKNQFRYEIYEVEIRKVKNKDTSFDKWIREEDGYLTRLDRILDDVGPENKDALIAWLKNVWDHRQ